jgi:hypothetical protein
LFAKSDPGASFVDLIPWLSMVAPFIDDMEKALIIEKFVRVWKERFESLLSGKGKAPETRSELRDWADAVKAIATDTNGSAKIEAVTFGDGKKKIRAAFKFKSSDAREVLKTVERQQQLLEKTQHADHRRVLMRFTRSDIGDVLSPSAVEM